MAESRATAAWGRAILCYPFVFLVLAVIVALEGTRSTRPGDFLGWMLWSLLWVGIAAFAAGFVVVPLLFAEVWLWSFVTDRTPWFETTWAGVIASAAILAAPWALAPQRVGWGGPLLLFLGILAARVIVPSLRPR